MCQIIRANFALQAKLRFVSIKIIMLFSRLYIVRFCCGTLVNDLYMLIRNIFDYEKVPLTWQKENR